MKFEKIEAGMTLYDVHSYRMGNTTKRTLGTWLVKILEVDAERRRARVSWNGNSPEWLGERSLSKLKAERPYLVRTGMGSYRRPTKEELAAYRASKKAGNTQ